MQSGGGMSGLCRLQTHLARRGLASRTSCGCTPLGPPRRTIRPLSAGGGDCARSRDAEDHSSKIDLDPEDYLFEPHLLHENTGVVGVAHFVFFYTESAHASVRLVALFRAMAPKTRRSGVVSPAMLSERAAASAGQRAADVRPTSTLPPDRHRRGELRSRPANCKKAHARPEWRACARAKPGAVAAAK